MDINMITNRRAGYVRNHPQTTSAAGQSSATASAQDIFELSPERRAAIQTESVDAVTEEPAGPGTATAFTSFGQEFSKVIQNYSNTIREHYAREHAENLTYSNPSAHIWDKYKNPESPSFRSDLSEDERAWAYDQELDLLNGGKHLQMGNPYAFPDGAPTLASAAAQANQACREQISQSIQALLVQNGVELPEDASFRLTVDSSYSIHVASLEDGELAQSIEKVLNCGDNGKNLYDHLKLTGDTGVNYAGGQLDALGARWQPEDDALAEVKKQTSPFYFHFSSAYNPHQKPLMSETIIRLAPNVPPCTQEEADRANAAVRLNGPKIIAQFRSGTLFPDQQPLVVNKYSSVDPDGSIALNTYIQSYTQQTAGAKKVIEDYYAAAHRENSSYPDPLNHLAEKYKLPWSDIFRSDLSERQRDMYYRQERSLLMGGRVTLLDPYALASIGGVPDMEACHSKAMQAVREKLDALWEATYGSEA